MSELVDRCFVLSRQIAMGEISQADGATAILELVHDRSLASSSEMSDRLLKSLDTFRAEHHLALV